MVDAHILGAYTFGWNPDTMDIPESAKVVAEEKTYKGSAIFQWPALIEGQPVTMKWDWMSIAQYNSLRTLYLSPDVITWDPQYLGTYQVIVTSLKGTYIKVSLNDIAYRESVELTLNIRSGPA